MESKEEGGLDSSFEILVSRDFTRWLAEHQVSLAFTHPPFKLFLIGIRTDGELSVFERTFIRCMGLAYKNDALFVSTLYQIWRLENGLPPGGFTEDGYDRQFIPRKVYTTGAQGTHDLAVDRFGRILFINTRFGCLATASDRYSFIPIWQPPFLPDLIPGDRCHVNGLALKNGLPAYVTCVSQTDSFEGWRNHRREGGIVIDLETNQIVCRGLSMPHSPRVYQGQLWVANSGTGYLGRVDCQRGCFEPIVFAPGFLRGLAFVGDFAVVGSSKPRHGDAYSDLELDDTLREKGLEPRLGIFIMDLKKGEVAHWLLIQSAQTRELYDVTILNGIRQPMALGLMTEEIQKTIWFDPRWQECAKAYWENRNN
jgi:uncharacterized protein (TIGR03032 family)